MDIDGYPWDIHIYRIKTLIDAISPRLDIILPFQSLKMICNSAVIEPKLLFNIVIMITGILPDMLVDPASCELVENLLFF